MAITMAMLPLLNLLDLLNLPSGQQGSVRATTVRKPPGHAGIFSSEIWSTKQPHLLAPSNALCHPSTTLSRSVPTFRPYGDFSCPLTDLHDPRASRRIDRPEHSAPTA